MAKLSNAEKQRRYREKRRLNDERENNDKLKNQARYHAKKTLIGALAERDQRAQRKAWRARDKRRRAKQNHISSGVLLLAPPDSPVPGPSANVKRGRKTILRNRSKLNRVNCQLFKENKILKEQLARLKRSAAKYKKRSQRADTHNMSAIQLTPRSKSKKLLSDAKREMLQESRRNVGSRTINMNSPIGKFLVTANSLITSMKSNSNSGSSKKFLGNILLDKTIAKSRVRKIASNLFGLADRKRQAKARQIQDNSKKKLIRAFFNSDEVSRTTAGKKETITKHKDKRQKRFLTDNMKALHLRFKELDGATGISYSEFARLRPFNVLRPTASDRDTCLCRYHANIELKAIKLHYLRVIKTSNAHELVHNAVCDKLSANCMYNLCPECKDKTVETNHDVTPLNTETFWWKFDTVCEEREKVKDGKSVKFSVTFTSKLRKTGTVKDLLQEFDAEIIPFKTHVFNIRQQNAAYRMCREKLLTNEALLHIDFSENYACKLSSEVQSFHFGAARNQVTLHTGVLYMGDPKKPLSFCTLSPSFDHQPGAIWAHLDPILKLIKVQAPDIDTIHFFSDGPSSQYRQKKNFYLFSTRLFEYGYPTATWSFFEAGHGKGAADGIGGTIKRAADAKVAHATDIPNALSLFKFLKQSSTTIKVFYVTEKQIQASNQLIPTNVKTVIGTQKLHNMIVLEKCIISHRLNSCFCNNNDWQNKVLCVCHGTSKIANLLPTNDAIKKNIKPALCVVTPIKRTRKKKIRELSETEDSSVIVSDSDGDGMDVIASFNDDFVPSEPEDLAEEPTRVGTFVLAEYPKSSKVFYVGKILQIDDGESIKVDFMSRTATLSSRTAKFVWPAEPDVEFVDISQIKLTLGLPRPLRRNEFTFDVDFQGFRVK